VQELQHAEDVQLGYHGSGRLKYYPKVDDSRDSLFRDCLYLPYSNLKSFFEREEKLAPYAFSWHISEDIKVAIH